MNTSLPSKPPAWISVLVLSLLGVGLLGGCEKPGDLPDATPNRVQAPAEVPVLLLSIDGLRHDYLELHDAPTLDSLRNASASVERFVPSFPTKTFPNHYTLVTGLHPGNHGIVANSMYDPEMDASFSMSNEAAVTNGDWWDDGEPIWVTAEQQGLRAATYFWPGSEAEIDGTRPSYWTAYDGSVPGNERVDTVLDWLDLPEAKRPSFLTLYFSTVDTQGHRHGPESDEVATAMQAVDGYVQRLIDGLSARGMDVNLFITGDHGMVETARERAVVVDEHINLDDVQIVDYTPVGMMNPRAGVDPQPIIDTLDALDHVSAYHRSETPEDLHFRDHPRIPEIIAIADPGWSLTTTSYLEDNPDGLSGATHGYVPSTPDMQTLLIANGPAFEADTQVETLDFVDLYPLMTHLLDLDPASHDGSLQAARGLLRAAE
ncbi:alkaline phosphatase family protein [Longimonas halophila]|uniref:Alkaline phosphatase family protein n=1 Tax=Longimonas halophila TaxID=1469170 RepID=A0A2H3P3S1_9BACT|nr:ectonucleotide pyrophosphatase/phosphodiesterase [Longimonas halophila]PEN06072.1 alkaline phosphatase family protein [Longimonas halophila]